MKSKDTLIIIGNGFDIWQGLDTSYDEFRKYYLAHRVEIMKKLRIPGRILRDEKGRKTVISDVELIYGDPFDPGQLDREFWNTFEASLDQLDTERLNLFFGKNRGDLRKMDRSIQNASRILREAFCRWISTITIEEKDTDFRFGDHCLFINFNYTDTLIKRFKVRACDEYHIHGEAADKKSIIFGHSTHPQLPEKMLYRLGGRFRGLYFVDKILYETDKHVQDNIQGLCMFLALHGCMAEEIKEIYVLGHSMGLPDIEYFAFLADAVRVHSPEEFDPGKRKMDQDSMEEFHKRLQYTINRIGYQTDERKVDPQQMEAAARKFSQEQEARNQELQTMFFKSMRNLGKNDVHGTNPKSSHRAGDAAWHISYYSDRDKRWMEAVMNTFGYKKVTFYSTIDECLAPFKQKTII